MKDKYHNPPLHVRCSCGRGTCKLACSLETFEARSLLRKGNGHWRRPPRFETKNNKTTSVRFLDFQRLSKPLYVKRCLPSRFECRVGFFFFFFKDLLSVLSWQNSLFQDLLLPVPN